MKYYVNSDCIGCGLCASICPEIFELNGDGIAQAKDVEAIQDVQTLAEEAMESCPTSAIEERT